jgi:hypothetical protein
VPVPRTSSAADTTAGIRHYARMNLSNFFEEDDFYTGPPLTEALILRAEEILGVHLPAVYVALLEQRNGGVPRRRCLRTDFATSWADGYFEVRALLGIGGERGIDSAQRHGSRYLIAEWGYPDIGVVICEMPSGGHDAVMLDYSACGPEGEPSVAYVDEDRIPRRVAESFPEFVVQLKPCSTDS